MVGGISGVTVAASVALLAFLPEDIIAIVGRRGTGMALAALPFVRRRAAGIRVSVRRR